MVTFLTFIILLKRFFGNFEPIEHDDKKSQRSRRSYFEQGKYEMIFEIGQFLIIFS